MRLSKIIALALASAGCGDVAEVVIDAGNGCIITRPTKQSCIWDVTVSSASACGTALDGGNLVDSGFSTTYTTQICSEMCGSASTQCSPDPAGNPDLVQCGQGCIGGRSTAGAEGVGAAGHALARMAHLEATSVHAFEVLEGELAAHGAPRTLRAAARRAGRDEVRHARAMSRLARRYGRATPPVRVRRGPVRPLLAVAVENAAEGCVREMFGATVAAWQARHAGDPAVRKVMRTIARDERRHAELAFRIAAWAESRLDAFERAAIREARRAAIAGLVRSCEGQRTDASLGLPGQTEMLAMVRSLASSVWQ